MIIISKYIVPKNYLGITFYPFIFLKNNKLKENKRLVNHEKIHLKQQLELLWIPFFVWYVLEFSIKYLKYRDFMTAYENISFEKEAYQNDQNLDYLKNRKWYAFLNYL